MIVGGFLDYSRVSRSCVGLGRPGVRFYCGFGSRCCSELGLVRRGRREVKAPDRSTCRDSLSFERAKLSRDDERRPRRLSNHAPQSASEHARSPLCGADGRAKPRPSAYESFALALSPALCAGFQRDRWSRPAYVVGAGSSSGERSSPTSRSLPSRDRRSLSVPPGDFTSHRVVGVVTQRTVCRSGTRRSQYSPPLPDCWRPKSGGLPLRSSTARFRSPADRVRSGFQNRPKWVATRRFVRV
jgi:hypothetical protein